MRDSGGYVDGHASGWTELRVHGVSGTPATATLEAPDVRLVAGYAQAGFFRRVWESGSIAADTRWRRREAYSWGGLTSGDTTRALWLLLLPFMLLNVAYYMAPSRRPPNPQGTPPAEFRCADRRDRISGSVQSLLALTFTATFTLTAITIAMDLAGWQCAAHPTDGRPCGSSWLAWLGSSVLDRPGRQLAATAVVPLATVGLLWWLARTTWQNLEAVEVAQTGGDAPEVVTPLEDRALWNGRAAVRRLRALHVATGLALPGVFVLAPLRVASPGDTAGLLTWVLLALLAGVLVVAAVLTVVPTIRRRTRPTVSEAGRPARERTDVYTVLPWIALGLTVVAAGVVAWKLPATRPTPTLPWLVGSGYLLFLGQAVLLVALFVVCWRLKRHPPDARVAPPTTTRPAAGQRAEPVVVAPAWKGMAMPLLALLAWVLAGGISAGVILRAAQTLGTPVAAGQRSDAASPLVVPTACFWTAVGGLVLGLIALVCAGVAWLRVRGSSRTLAMSRAAVDAAYTADLAAARWQVAAAATAAAAAREAADAARAAAEAAQAEAAAAPNDTTSGKAARATRKKAVAAEKAAADAAEAADAVKVVAAATETAGAARVTADAARAAADAARAQAAAAPNDTTAEKAARATCSTAEAIAAENAAASEAAAAATAATKHFPGYDERRDEIADAWHQAGALSRATQTAFGALLVAALVVVVVGVVCFLIVEPEDLLAVPYLVDTANVAISGFVLALLWVGRQAYRSPAARRTVGIVWDLGTFWPRAVHPLAPPCYAERAVPDLLLRLRFYKESGGRVLLSCHSQGTVLGAVVLLQAETAVSRQTAFLTYGSPLARLYGGFFPAYFSPAALRRLGGFLAGPSADAPDRATWRWRNLYRPSDPIGGPVFLRRDPVFPDDTRPDADPGDVDRPLRDPVFARPPGDPCYPPVLGHRDYFADPAFAWTARALGDGVLPPRSGKPRLTGS